MRCVRIVIVNYRTPRLVIDSPLPARYPVAKPSYYPGKKVPHDTNPKR
jgi:hypothetical protein